MHHISPSADNQVLPYAQASVAQREQLLTYLRLRLPYHFPTLSLAAWLRVLFEFQPTLLLSDNGSVTFDPPTLQQLVQHVAGSPELPLLDPPVYSLATLDLAQHCLHGSELAAAVLPELVPGTGGPRLLALLTYLGQPYALAEQVVQAWRWDLASAPSLPPPAWGWAHPRQRSSQALLGPAGPRTHAVTGTAGRGHHGAGLSPLAVGGGLGPSVPGLPYRFNQRRSCGAAYPLPKSSAPPLPRPSTGRNRRRKKLTSTMDGEDGTHRVPHK